MYKKLIVLVGLPASGKSTYVKNINHRDSSATKNRPSSTSKGEKSKAEKNWVAKTEKKSTAVCSTSASSSQRGFFRFMESMTITDNAICMARAKMRSQPAEKISPSEAVEKAAVP